MKLDRIGKLSSYEGTTINYSGKEIIMAHLVKCPVCGRQDVSSDAKACPGCGADVAKAKKEETERFLQSMRDYFHGKAGSQSQS